MTVLNTGTAAASNNIYKKVIFKDRHRFTDWVSEINNKEINHAKDIHVLMPMYNLIDHSNNYLKTSGSLWQYCKNEPFITDDGVVIDIPDDPDSASLKYKQKITSQTGNDGTKDIQIMIPVKYLSSFGELLKY